jgi:hypothetical protein
MNAPAHKSVDHEVKYLEKVPLPGWHQTGTSPDISVDGPCPECFGSAYGPIEPADADEESLLAARQQPGIVAGCRCDLKHGKEDNCGRWWIVPIDIEEGA